MDIKIRMRFHILLIVVVFGAGCQNSLDSKDPHIPELPKGWTKIEWGSGTLCAGGDPYSFWVRPGKENKLVIFFQGGGACWNDRSCWLKRSDCVDCNGKSPAMLKGNGYGIFDFDNLNNPFYRTILC